MSWRWGAAPWWLLAGGMLVDELYFHRRRGLPRWERLGHPVDTAAVLACLAIPLLLPPAPAWRRLFAALAAGSIALVTKDEAVHLRRCGPGEARLHALLFMLHPLALLCALLAWPVWPGLLAQGQAEPLRRALAAQLGLGLLFLIYQAVYWNLLCESAPASTTTSTTS